MLLKELGERPGTHPQPLSRFAQREVGMVRAVSLEMPGRAIQVFWGISIGHEKRLQKKLCAILTSPSRQCTGTI